MKISVVINTFNSESTLRDCLEGVKSFDEIIICDMYSEDNTLAIAKEYNTQIIMHERCGGIVEPARDLAIKSATSEWILIVDSDEVVLPHLKNYLYQIIHSENSLAGLLVPRKNYFMNKYMRADFPDYQFRFFRKSKYINWPVTIHSRPIIEGKIDKIPAKKSLALDHLDKNRIGNTLFKMARYSDRELEKRTDKKENLITLILKPFFLFCKFYFFKLGFLDGIEGFIFCRFKAYSKFLTISRVLERKKLNISEY